MTFEIQLSRMKGHREYWAYPDVIHDFSFKKMLIFNLDPKGRYRERKENKRGRNGEGKQALSLLTQPKVSEGST